MRRRDPASWVNTTDCNAAVAKRRRFKFAIQPAAPFLKSECLAVVRQRFGARAQQLEKLASCGVLCKAVGDTQDLQCLLQAREPRPERHAFARSCGRGICARIAVCKARDKMGCSRARPAERSTACAIASQALDHVVVRIRRPVRA